MPLNMMKRIIRICNVQDTGDSHRSLYCATEHDEKDNKDNVLDTDDSHRSIYYATEHDEKDNRDNVQDTGDSHGSLYYATEHDKIMIRIMFKILHLFRILEIVI